MESQYEVGRNGYHMLTRFQCDICHFRNINGRSPEVSNLKDKTLLETIQRESLDAFWSRGAETI